MTVYILYYTFLLLGYCAIRRSKIDRKCRKSRQQSEKVFLNDLGLLKSVKSEKPKGRWFVFFVLILLVLIVGLRNQSMGYDLQGYLPAFKIISKQSWSQVIERNYLNYDVGYRIFNKIVGSIVLNENFFLFVCAAFSILPINILILKESKMPLLSSLIFLGLPFFLASFSALRQAIAIGITVLSYFFIKKRRFFPFLILTVLASAFHWSAFIFIFAYPLYTLKYNRIVSYGSIVLLLLIWLMKFQVFLFFTMILGYGGTDNNGAVKLFIFFTLVYIFCVIFGNRKNDETNGLINLFWVVCAIQAMGGLNIIATRIGYFYMVYLILLLPEVLVDMRSRMKTKDVQLIAFSIGTFFLFYGLFSLRYSTWAMTFPYRFFWQ